MSATAAIARLSPEEQMEAYRGYSARADALYKNDFPLWLREEVWTRDEAARETRRWPQDEPYLDELAAILVDPNEPLIGIPKSRRMKATWTVAALLVHQARYFENLATYFQSETEQKAAFTVQERCKFIEDHLDNPLLRRGYSEIRTQGGQVGRMTYEQTGSYILAIPEGDDKIRAYTPSILVMDESDFQPRGHQALVAALPTVEKAAKLIVLSSSNGPLGVLAGIAKDAGFVRWSG